jgi:nitrate/TMAO reductase-like tetraheme cytochrome c subunit
MKEGSSLDSPAAREQCESCHGPSARHVRFPLHVGNVRFTRRDDTTTKSARNHACLECHRGDERAQWEASPHGFDEITCVDCHVVHAVSDPILAKGTQTKRCAESCHLEILEKQPASTPHPLEGEEAVLCTACHDPHGPFEQSACLDCHPQQPRDLAAQSPKARGYHERAIAQEISCTECHQGFVHPLPPEISAGEPGDRVHADAAHRTPAHP